MVKNSTGGNKAKGQARKFVTAPKSHALRLAQDDSEIYAVVMKNLGNGMCHVLCMDNKTRLCHIRGKFTGRRKKENIIRVGSWVIIGLREWEAGKVFDKKLENCDLLEVYDDADKDRLKVTLPSLSWHLFNAHDTRPRASVEEDDGFEFMDERTAEYRDLIQQQIQSSSTAVARSITMDDQEINVDDI
jgi:initiation factor 1A